MVTEIFVEVRSNYGCRAIYPLCTTSNRLAALAGHRTLTPESISLIRALRALPAYQYTPMLMLTTEAGDGKKQEGRAAGATGWLVKPFNPEQLLATLKRVLPQ